MSNTPFLSAPEPTPRFQVIAANRRGVNYVLRDNLGGFDYPFKTRRSAIAAADDCRAKDYTTYPNLAKTPAGRFAASPSDVDAYMASGPILDSFVA